jgi:geranylgeranyl pyrophosphate synthase
MPDGRRVLGARFAAQAEKVEAELDGVLRVEDPQEARLLEAMRYSVLGGGKRIRPLLCLAAHEAVGGQDPFALRVAAALELVHAYSLVHDDLPCMDDDELRRGRPTTHRAFGEGMAVLAGDALLTLAFEALAGDPAGSRSDPAARLDVLRKIACAAGVRGMIGGQVGDLVAREHPGDAALIEYVHARKTGALIAASAWAGARLGTCDPDALGRIDRYGRALGFAFQVVDDLLDDSARPEEGASYVRCHGAAAARERAAALVAEARHAVEPFGVRAAALVDIADFVLSRAE